MTRSIWPKLSAALLLWTAIACSPTTPSDEAPAPSTASAPEAASDEAAAPTPPPAQDSIYVVDGTWTNQQGHAFEIASLQGAPTAIAMIFTHCGHACPTMVANMKEAQNTLPSNLRDRVQWVLITFDVEHDTPDVLARYAQNQRLNDQWTLLHGSEAQVRMISMLLGIQYTLLENGHYNHSNILTVLDKNGAITQQFEGLEAQTAKVVQAIQRADPPQ